jgi:hypothetical protein
MYNENTKPSDPGLREADILEVFEKLNLSTVNDRQQFLRLEKLGQAEPFSPTRDANPSQPLTVHFGHTTEANNR